MLKICQGPSEPFPSIKRREERDPWRVTYSSVACSTFAKWVLAHRGQISHTGAPRHHGKLMIGTSRKWANESLWHTHTTVCALTHTQCIQRIKGRDGRGWSREKGISSRAAGEANNSEPAVDAASNECEWRSRRGAHARTRAHTDQIIRGPPVALAHGGAVITVTTPFPVEDDNN